MVIQAGGTPQYYPLDIRWDTVSEQARRLYKEDGNGLNARSSASALQNLSALIEPVAAISKPGDTLVFSPAGVMHSIPMHALLVDGQLLIERNPIVYTSSMALLKNSFEAGQDLAATLSSGQLKWKAAVFDGNPPTSAGKEALSVVSDQLRAEAFLSERSTTAAFKATISQTSLLHYHGHAVFEHNEPWEHCLQLSAGELKARDLLEASPLGNAYHATLLGCGSGKLSITRSEVLGLVPAFIYSGAQSTISTLWSISDTDAVSYSRKFYEPFEKALASGQGIIDLAKAHRDAVLEIRKERPELYHWAPFVLNGYWMHRVG